jgi:ABC-type multidrug transport system ATPase subunit/pSer/pThr/pTyr-binding forkhead associated (FHA) protein/ABC-type multidrug transport system permease subunit
MKIGFIYNNKLIKKVKLEIGVKNLMIGRNANCDIIISAATISGHHAQLIMDNNGSLFLIDQNSTNGCYVNQDRLLPGVATKLKPEDKARLSKSDSVFIVFDPDNYESGSISGNILQNDDDTKASTNLLSKLREKKTIFIGRDQDCDLVLNNSNISRKHAKVERSSDGMYYVEDLNSTNGTYINGKKINARTSFNEKDVLFIGRYKLTLKGAAKDLSREVAIRADSIKKVFSNGKVGLHELTLDVPSNILLAVMGPSGCGKSTLLKALNGASPATFGNVYICGLELNHNYDYLKTQIGYVPQDDIVHRELTVEQSLRYSAKLRLQNFTDDQIEIKINTVLENLKISHIREQLVGDISGGQRKRVSIAVEILNDPLILFLDEPTSPLDPQTIEDFLGSLRKLCEIGTTVVIVTHKPEDLNYVDKVVFMAEGGHMAYSGDSKAYLPYFEVTDVVKVYSNLAGKKAGKWIDKFNETNSHNKSELLPTKPITNNTKTNYFLQYFWLTLRYFNIKLNDKKNTLIMIGQAPFIALLVCLIYENIELSVPFLLTVSAVWLGTNNAAREIVGELPIYIRERMFNLAILPYLLSKITVLGFFAAVQSLLFTAIISIRYINNNLVSWNDSGNTFLWMLLLSIVATLMGLLLSALVSTTEKVMSLVPLVLIPQIMLAGVVAKISNVFVEFLSYFSLSRWGTEGFCNIQKDVIFDDQKLNQQVKVNATEILKSSFHKDYRDGTSIFGSMHGTLRLDFIMIVLLGIIFFITICIALKQKDTIKIN